MSEEILARAEPLVEAADVYAVESNRAEVEFRQGKFYAQGMRLMKGWGLRVIKGGRVGFASSTNPQRVKEMVGAACAAAAYGREARFSLPEPGEFPAVPTFENRVMLVSTERMREWGKDLIDALGARVPELKVDVNFVRVYQEIGVRNTAGLDVSFERAELSATVVGLLVNDGIYWFFEYVNLSDGKPFPLETVVERMESLVKMARRRARLKSGEYPVVVMPTALGDLLLPLQLAVSGKAREKGVSPLIGREGKAVLSEKLTIADNRLRPFGNGSAPFDGDGVPAKRNVLFERGVFKGFLYDLATGAACGCASTGSAVRGYNSLPGPGIGNLEVAPGDAQLGEVLKGIGEGLLVYGFIGGGQSNVTAGEVTLNVSCGFKIEQGAVAGRVKDISIAGNVYDMFQRVSAVGSTVRNLGDAFLPFICFSNLKVATKE